MRGTGSGQNLTAQEATGDLRGPVHQRLPGSGVGVHEGPRAKVILGGTPFNEVGRKGKGGTGETDQRSRRNAIASTVIMEHGNRSAHAFPNGLAQLIHDGGIDCRELCDVGGRCEGSIEDRAAAGLNANIHTNSFERHNNVTEENAGIRLMAPHGLHRYLARHGGIKTGVEHLGTHTQRSVLGKRATGLAHEPHRGGLGTISAQCSNQPGCVCSMGVQWVSLRERHKTYSAAPCCDKTVHAPDGEAASLEFAAPSSADFPAPRRRIKPVLLSLSANHKNTTFEVLEILSAADADLLPELVRSAHPAIVGAVVVSTCNRFEAYIDMDEAAGVSPVAAMNAVFDSLAQIADVKADHLRDTVHFAHGNAVAQHLFSVASGLESVVIGEGEIAGQVRRSLEHARNVGTSSPELERLFQRASETSRQVKNSTAVGETGRSLVRLSLDLAESRITNWSECRVLLVGTGRYAAASLAALRDRGVTDVRVYSVSGRGAKFASNHDLPLVLRADYPREAALAGVIVTCTTAPHFVIEAEILSAGRNILQCAPGEAERASRQTNSGMLSLISNEPAHPERQLLIDLGLPRNINPDVRDIKGVELLDLETIRRHAPLDEEHIVREARALINSATRKFVDVGHERSVTDGVVALRAHIFDLLDGEISRLGGKADSPATAEEALRHFAGVLLHTPMMRSRELSQRGEAREWLESLTAMFGITPAPATVTVAETMAETDLAAEG